VLSLEHEDSDMTANSAAKRYDIATCAARAASAPIARA
jgi:hypothetical protein